MTQSDVLIVGGGPVGMTLALELARSGVRAILLNDGADTAAHPRANLIGARTMEHFRRHGLADRVRAAGLPPDHPADVCYVTRLDGFEMARVRLPSSRETIAAARAGTSPFDGPEPPQRCCQIFLERILYDAVRTAPGIDLRFGHRLDAFVDRGDGVRATVTDLAAGQQYEVEAAWLVGADGGRGPVRRQLAIRYEGDAGVPRPMMGGAMMATFFRAPRDDGWLAVDPAWQYWIVNPALRALMISVDGGERFVLLARVPDDTPPEAIDDMALLEAAAGRPVAAEVILRQPWTAGHALLAREYRRGRVFLAGDAAHLFTPTGGLGMNTGVDDAVNLAWKLAAAVNGWAGAGLLDSYEADRRPIGARNLAFATSFAESIGSFAVDPVVETETAEGAAERDRLGAYLADHGRREFITPGIALGLRYEGSAIVWPDGTAPTPDEPWTYVPTARPGSRAPHLWLGDGSALMDRFARDGFTLLRTDGGAEMDAILAAARTRGVPCTPIEVHAPAVRGLYGAALVLIAPDGHVAWRGEAPPDAGALVDRVRGA